MPSSNLMNSIPQVGENESLHQVAEKLLQSSGKKLDIVNDEDQVTGTIT